MEQNNDDIKKCLKSFLTGKKYIQSDKDKAFDYFRQALKYINIIKKTNNNKEIKTILDETETECNKIINLAVEQTIEKEPKELINLDLFKLIEKGEVNDLKNIKSYQINFNIYDEDGLTPIHKAIKFGDTSFLKEAFKLGASIDIVNQTGNTALEFACLEKDPNMINFLLKNGCDMKKHLLFRDGNKKYKTNQNYIDCSIILKIIFSYPEEDNYEEIKFLFNNFKETELINFDKYTYLDLIKCLSSLLKKIKLDNKEVYLSIIREEFQFPLRKSLGCPYNKLEILLTYLVPFIDYPFNISQDWYINLELKYLIIKLLKEKSLNNIEIKNNLINYLWENYIKKNILHEEYLGNLISQWVSKIKT